jgi:CRP-like cAMP-binding protein
MLSKDVFFHLLREFPDFSLAVMRDLANRLERSTMQIRALRDGNG